MQSIERAFAVLRTLALGGMGVTEIAERTDLPKSTVARLLDALDAEGAVVQREAGGQYALGPTLATLGASAGPAPGLRSVVRPFAEHLASTTGGSAGFTVRRGDEAYWVDNVDDEDELVTMLDQTGLAFPLHEIPSGVAILARQGADEVDRYVASTFLLGDRDDEAVALRRRISSVGSDGVFSSLEDFDAGVNAVAAAFSSDGETWDAALYVQGPSFRFPDGDVAEVCEAVAEAVVALGARLAAD